MKTGKRINLILLFFTMAVIILGFGTIAPIFMTAVYLPRLLCRAQGVYRRW